MDAAKRVYIITDQAGDWVAGQRVKRGKTVLQSELALTASEADHPLRVGEIVLKASPTGSAKPANAAPKGKTKE